MALNASLDEHNKVASILAIAPPMRINLRPIFAYPLCPTPFFELRKLTRMARQRLSLVRVPVTPLHSKMDETVSMKSAAGGLSGARRERRTLETAWYAHFSKGERVQIMETLLARLREGLRKANSRQKPQKRGNFRWVSACLFD
ncbi:MAG: hypothetical protein LBD02_10200 [Christensenellaceae bacterium]|nr:hypothetical protein [Christensenellaceae bacterium]